MHVVILLVKPTLEVPKCRIYLNPLAVAYQTFMGILSHDLIKAKETSLFPLGEIAKSSPDPSLHQQL